MSDGQKRRKRSSARRGIVKKGKAKIVILAAAVVIIAAVLVVFLIRHKEAQKEKALVEKGVKYLNSLESQDVEEIQKDIKSGQATITLELADTDESAIWAAMADAVILGDSRAVGFYYHEFMPEDHVLAKGGGKITDVSEYLDQLVALKPTEVFLCYGLNDVGIGTWPTGEEYATEYEKQVNLLKEKIPDATIYVNSILPAVGEGLEADPDYPRIDEYNTALKAMCEKNDWPYIDNTQLAQDYQSLYQEDGLHVQKEFYKYWAANMLAGVSE